MEPLSEQIIDVENNVAAIFQRNKIVDEQVRGMKIDILSLNGKIMDIKVDFENVRHFSTNYLK